MLLAQIRACFRPLGRYDEAARVFDRTLWLNPADNQGVRFLIRDVAAAATVGGVDNFDKWYARQDSNL